MPHTWPHQCCYSWESAASCSTCSLSHLSASPCTAPLHFSYTILMSWVWAVVGRCRLMWHWPERSLHIAAKDLGCAPPHMFHLRPGSTSVTTAHCACSPQALTPSTCICTCCTGWHRVRRHLSRCRNSSFVHYARLGTPCLPPLPCAPQVCTADGVRGGHAVLGARVRGGAGPGGRAGAAGGRGQGQRQASAQGWVY